MKEIISGLWVGTKDDLFRKEIHNKIQINCHFNDTFLSTDLVIQQFLEKQSNLVSTIQNHLTNQKQVFLYSSNETTQLNTHILLVIAFFIKYTDINISNLIPLISKKLNQSILQNCNRSIYKNIITNLRNQYR